MKASLRNKAAVSPHLGLLLLLVSSLCTSQTVAASRPGNFDGPAELPRETVKSSLKDTPAGGKTWMVRSGQSIEEALSRASCGDIIQLQAGATFVGHVGLPAKNCDDLHWIVIRTSAPDSALPPEGTRLNPCFAGISSLPGRAPFNCGSSTNVMARIEFDGKNGSGPIQVSPGANHYRLIGLEVTRAASPATIYNLVQFNGPADHLVFDRLWMHGTSQNETVRGIMLGLSRHVAVVDSFFTDFHCVAKTGACVDAQAVAGGIGDGPMGPYKIVNNYLEASGENIMFGGGHAASPPQDIEIRHNHMFKPLTWMRGQAGYVGGTDGSPFIVKNLLELKNGQRVLIEGNVMENSWGGFSQVGFAVLLTPKNPGGNGSNLCAACAVTDVTVRYDSIRHVAAGLQIGNGLSDYGGAALDGQRYSIHDVTIDDIDGAKYSGPSEFAQVSMGQGAAHLQNVTINHVTAFPSTRMFVIGGPGGTVPPMNNFVFSNNIVNAGSIPMLSTGSGGKANCAYGNSPVNTITSCFSNFTFAANAIIDSPPNKQWPGKNFFPSSAEAVRFVSYSGGNGGDYHLQESSPYKHAGTDGKALGADIDAIRSATAGAE